MVTLVVRYAFFAVLSTLVNLAFQYASFFFYSGFLSLYVAMFWGTLAGLVLKYLLDKKYIFGYTSTSRLDDGKKFGLYSLMGVFTTLIFWGTEMLFHYTFDSEFSKYIGAVLGLSIGYVTKYFLDKNFVFKEAK